MNEEKQYCTIYLARHGETEANINHICSGFSDSPLTENGINQAKDLGRRLKDVHFDAVFSSDIWRAHHTAKLALLDRQLTITTSKLLREKNFGAFEERPYSEHKKEIENILNQMKIITDKERFKIKASPTEESEEEAVVRFIRALREISLAYLGKTIFIVSHGATMRLLLTHLGFGTRQELLGSVTNTAHVVLESDGIDFFVKETFGINKKDLSDHELY